MRNMSTFPANSTADTLCEPPPIESYMTALTQVIIPVIFGIVVAIGLVGNLLVIVVIIVNNQMRNTTNILIISLAVADLLFIAFCVPSTAALYAAEQWNLGNIFCKVYNYTIYVSVYCSVYTLVLMSVDRFLAVVYPIESITLRTEQNTIIAVCVTWFVCLVAHSPLAYYSATRLVAMPSASNETCTVILCSNINSFHMEHMESIDRWRILSKNLDYFRMFHTIFFVCAYVIPLTVICILYFFLIRRLVYGRSSRVGTSAESMRSKKRVTCMVVIVIIIFAICWLPIQVIFLIQSFAKDQHTPLFRTVHAISNCLAYANSCVNPILYAFLSENFRRAFAKVLCPKRAVYANQQIDFERTNCANQKTLLDGQKQIRESDEKLEQPHELSKLDNNINHVNDDAL